MEKCPAIIDCCSISHRVEKVEIRRRRRSDKKWPETIFLNFSLEKIINLWFEDIDNISATELVDVQKFSSSQDSIEVTREEFFRSMGSSREMINKRLERWIENDRERLHLIETCLEMARKALKRRPLPRFAHDDDDDAIYVDITLIQEHDHLLPEDYYTRKDRRNIE